MSGAPKRAAAAPAFLIWQTGRIPARFVLCIAKWVMEYSSYGNYFQVTGLLFIALFLRSANYTVDGLTTAAPQLRNPGQPGVFLLALVLGLSASKSAVGGRRLMCSFLL